MFVQIDHYEHSVKLPEYRDAKASALIILVYIVFLWFSDVQKVRFSCN